MVTYILKKYLNKQWFELPVYNARDEHEYRHRWVKIGPSVLLSEHVDLFSFLFFFPKQCLVENVQGKFQKNSSATFSSEESP